LKENTGAKYGAGLEGVNAALRPMNCAWLRRLAGKLMFALNYRQIKQRYDTYALEMIYGVPLACIPGVFNPKLMRTGEFFASHISSTDVGRQSAVLDLGTGSGVCAIFAARQARRVVGVDINPAAVRCATANALLNNLQDVVDFRQGDLYAPVEGERFDLILFNPPFLFGTPASALDHAWRSNDVAERFADGLGRHLNSGGHALILLSTYSDMTRFVAALDKQNLSLAVVAERSYYNERLVIVRIQPVRQSSAGAHP
jgi:release factor glutamine methyltransferase